MTWAKFHTNYADAYEFEGNPWAELIDARATMWTSRNDTDGHIPLRAIPEITRDIRTRHWRHALHHLVAVGLWTDVADGWQMQPYRFRKWVAGPPVSFARRQRDLMNADLRSRVLERDGHKCLACGATDDLEIDHDVPVSRGGRTELSNLGTLCGPCNRRKWTKTMAEFLAAR